MGPNKDNTHRTDCHECAGEGVQWDNTQEYERDEDTGEMIPPLCVPCKGYGYIRTYDNSDEYVEYDDWDESENGEW